MVYDRHYAPRCMCNFFFTSKEPPFFLQPLLTFYVSRLFSFGTKIWRIFPIRKKKSEHVKFFSKLKGKKFSRSRSSILGRPLQWLYDVYTILPLSPPPAPQNTNSTDGSVESYIYFVVIVLYYLDTIKRKSPMKAPRRLILALILLSAQRRRFASHQTVNF